MGGSFLEAPGDGVVGSVRFFEPATLSDGLRTIGLTSGGAEASRGSTRRWSPRPNDSVRVARPVIGARTVARVPTRDRQASGGVKASGGSNVVYRLSTSSVRRVTAGVSGARPGVRDGLKPRKVSRTWTVADRPRKLLVAANLGGHTSIHGEHASARTSEPLREKAAWLIPGACESLLGRMISPIPSLSLLVTLEHCLKSGQPNPRAAGTHQRP